MARRMAAGVNVRSVDTIRDRGDVYTISPQPTGGQWSRLLPLVAAAVT